MGRSCRPRIAHNRLAELKRKGFMTVQRRGHRSAERTIVVPPKVHEVDAQGPRRERREVHDTDFSYERQIERHWTQPEASPLKAAVILEDSDHARVSLLPEQNSSSQPSSTGVVGSTSKPPDLAAWRARQEPLTTTSRSCGRTSWFRRTPGIQRRRAESSGRVALGLSAHVCRWRVCRRRWPEPHPSFIAVFSGPTLRGGPRQVAGAGEDAPKKLCLAQQ